MQRRLTGNDEWHVTEKGAGAVVTSWLQTLSCVIYQERINAEVKLFVMFCSAVMWWGGNVQLAAAARINKQKYRTENMSDCIPQNTVNERVKARWKESWRCRERSFIGWVIRTESEIKGINSVDTDYFNNQLFIYHCKLIIFYIELLVRGKKHLSFAN